MHEPVRHTHWFGDRRVVVAFFLCAVAFIAFPQIDIATSRPFLAADGRFVFAHHPLVHDIHVLISASARVLTVVLLAWLLLGFAARYGGVFARAAPYRRQVGFVFAVLALGPGLVVNAILKDHSGRARPAQIAEFGGEREFSRAFAIADQCKRNCAFVSGHVAYAAMPLVG